MIVKNFYKDLESISTVIEHSILNLALIRILNYIHFSKIKKFDEIDKYFKDFFKNTIDCREQLIEYAILLYNHFDEDFNKVQKFIFPE